MELENLVTEYQSLRLDEVIDHKKFSEFAVTHHSTYIDGSTLTENETTLLLDEGITPKGKPLEHSLMVKDHDEALKFVLSAAQLKKVVTVPFLQAINARLLKSIGMSCNTPHGTTVMSKGEFRKENVTTGGYYFPNYIKVEQLTSALVEHLQSEIARENSITERIELSHTAHFELVNIHPYYEGNGRTSRLLMNYIQAYYEIPLGIVHKEDRVEYFLALTEARKKKDISIFQDFMKAQYKKLLEEEIKQYRKMINGESLLPKQSTDYGREKSMYL